MIFLKLHPKTQKRSGKSYFDFTDRLSFCFSNAPEQACIIHLFHIKFQIWSLCTLIRFKMRQLSSCSAIFLCILLNILFNLSFILYLEQVFNRKIMLVVCEKQSFYFIFNNYPKSSKILTEAYQKGLKFHLPKKFRIIDVKLRISPTFKSLII